MDISLQDAYVLMEKERIFALPVVDASGKLQGIYTKDHCVRMDIYSPCVDQEGNLELGVAVSVHQGVEKVQALFDMGVRIFVLDTAHGFQKSMGDFVAGVRAKFGDQLILIAGNVMTKEGTKFLLDAGADGVKVGIGP